MARRKTASCLVTNCFSTQTSYENQTKKAINNRFIQQAMTAFFKERLTTYLIENKEAAGKIVEQVLINKRSRENAEKTRQSIKTNMQQKTDMANRVQKFIDCRSKDKGRREVYIVEGDSAAGAIRTSRDAEFQRRHACSRQDSQLLEGRLPAHFQSLTSSWTCCAFWVAASKSKTSA